MTLNVQDPVSVEGRWNTKSAPGDIIITGSGRWMHMTAAWPGRDHCNGVALQSGTRVFFAFWNGGSFTKDYHPGQPPPGPGLVTYTQPFLTEDDSSNPDVLSGYWALTTEGAGADVALRAARPEGTTVKGDGEDFAGFWDLAFTPAGVAPARVPYTIDLRKVKKTFPDASADKSGITGYTIDFRPKKKPGPEEPPDSGHFHGVGIARCVGSNVQQLVLAWGPPNANWQIIDVDTNRNANDREWVTRMKGWSWTSGGSPEPITFDRTLKRTPP